MPTHYVLIDFESVQPETLAGLDGGDFKVIVFVGGHQSKVPYEIAAALQRLGDKADYIKISGSGPNALDFHIAFYIGHFAAQNPSACFHIVSRDTGFDPLIHHLKERKIVANRVKEIRELLTPVQQDRAAEDQLAEAFKAKLANPKFCKPRTVKSLSRALQAMFPSKKLSEEQAKAVVAHIANKKLIAVNGQNVSYPALNASQLLLV